MKQKYCGTCERDKDVEEFNKNKSKPDGLNTICKLCSKKNSKKYYKEHSEKMVDQIIKRKIERITENRIKVNEYLLTHPCVDCEEGDLIVLEFDHVKGKKEYNVSELISTGYSWNRIKIEIDKCDVRCANCHRRKTAKQLNYHNYIKVNASLT